MALSGFLFIYIIIAINYWIRDVIREYTKKYEVLIIMLFIVFLVFVFSEALLFLSFFWVSFHTTCSPAAQDGIYVPDPCELTYTNTLLLSNAALSLGCAFICREAIIHGLWSFHFHRLNVGFFLIILCFLWMGAQLPQEIFISYGRILTLFYYKIIIYLLFAGIVSSLALQ